MSEPFDDTAKTFYRNLFQGWGLKVETEYQVYTRSRSIDLVVDCSSDHRKQLEDSVFAYFRAVNALELKGPADPLTLIDYNRIMMRAWGLGAMERRNKTRGRPKRGRRGLEGNESLALPGNRTVSIVCVTRPDHILDDLGDALGFKGTAEPGIYLNEGPLSCRVIVPSELPLEERYYALLPLARGRRLQEFIDLCIREGRSKYLRMALDTGLTADPMALWNKVLEVTGMVPTMTDEVYEVIDKVVQRMGGKLPSIREMLEEHDRREDAAWRTGEQQGEVKARQEGLLRLLRRKFGEPPAGMVSRIGATTDIAVLDSWLDRLLDASSLEEMGIGDDKGEE